MSFEPHGEFTPPEHDDTAIWRYMDLTKFLSVLDESALYFVRLDKLAEFDPFEGYYTTANLKLEQELKVGPRTEDDELRLHNLKNMRRMVKIHRRVTFVNSWHAQPHESAAMWSQYLKSQDGIAIRSTYKRLLHSLAREKQKVHIGLINYIDYQLEAIPFGSILRPFMCKRKSFEHESELRCLIWTPETPTKSMKKHGFYVPVDPNVLIQEIYVAPTSPTWVKKLVKSLMIRFGLDQPVKQSDLASVPVY